MNYKIYSNIIYILATGSLLIGSSLTFKYELPDYFYIFGTGLFFTKSLLDFIESIYTSHNHNHNDGYYITI